MSKTLYRVELSYSNKKPYYYLVKDIKVKDKQSKARVRLGNSRPSEKALEEYRKKYAYELEAKAVQKKAELSAQFFDSQYLTKEQIITIESIRWLYKAFTGLLTTSEVDFYEHSFEVNYVHGTTAIEGNTLTVLQTEDLLFNDIPPQGKTMREINEVQNFRKVKTYRDTYRKKINLDFIKNLHDLIMNNITNNSAGVFRRIDVTITGCDLSVTPAIFIQQELTELIDEYYRQLIIGIHPFEAAIMFHYNFEMIHPFLDGNGRVGREILNFMLKKCGYPRLLFLGQERSVYIDSLKKGNENKFAEMISAFADLISKQRYHVLMEKLKDVVVPPKDYKQMRIDEFYSIKKAD